MTGPRPLRIYLDLARGPADITAPTEERRCDCGIACLVAPLDLTGGALRPKEVWCDWLPDLDPGEVDPSRPLELAGHLCALGRPCVRPVPAPTTAGGGDRDGR